MWNDVDVLVITKNDILPERKIPAKYLYGYDFSELIQAGMHVIYRTETQVINIISDIRNVLTSQSPYRRLNSERGSDAILNLKNSLFICNNNMNWSYGGHNQYLDWPSGQYIKSNWYEDCNGILQCEITGKF